MKYCLILCNFLLLATGCLALAEPECGYESIARQNRERALPVMEEAPRRKDDDGAAWQAYTASITAVWKPIRFTFFSEDITDTKKYCPIEGVFRPTFREPGQTVLCTVRDILTPEKGLLLTTVLLPRAFELHSERLMVKPVTSNVVLPQLRESFCATFTAPVDHYTTGVPDTDMVMYVTAGPTAGTTAAWAGACAAVSSGRPVIGLANFGSRALENNRRGIRTAAHEIGHAMGFDSGVLQRKRMTTLFTIRHEKRYLVSSLSTLRRAREHYACSTLPGMELESRNGEDAVGSHWKRRNAREELMSPVSSELGYYSAMTMAAFEDTGFYKAIWGKEEHLPWAHRAGCHFLKEKCVENNKTKYPDMFCTGAERGFICSSDRRGIGRCPSKALPTNSSQESDDFDSPSPGTDASTATDAEICPVVQTFRNGKCLNGYGLPGNRFGPSSMCLKGRNLRIHTYEPGDVCAEVSCDNGTVFVRYDMDDTWYPCPAGTKLAPTKRFTGGRIECPKYRDVCSPLRLITDPSSSSSSQSTEYAKNEVPANVDNGIEIPEELEELDDLKFAIDAADSAENTEEEEEEEDKGARKRRMAGESAGEVQMGDTGNDDDDNDDDKVNDDEDKIKSDPSGSKVISNGGLSSEKGWSDEAKLNEMAAKDKLAILKKEVKEGALVQNISWIYSVLFLIYIFLIAA